MVSKFNVHEESIYNINHHPTELKNLETICDSKNQSLVKKKCSKEKNSSALQPYLKKREVSKTLNPTKIRKCTSDFVPPKCDVTNGTRIKKKESNVYSEKKIVALKQKCPPLKFVDSRIGSLQNFVGAETLPKSLYTNDYGKVPRYVRQTSYNQFKDRIDARNNKLLPCKSEYSDHYLPAYVRQDMLKELKAKYDECLNDYHKMPLQVLTKGCKKQMISLEAQLKNYEDDITRLERYPHHYNNGEHKTK